MISKIKNLLVFLTAIIVLIMSGEIAIKIISSFFSSRMFASPGRDGHRNVMHWKPDDVLHHVLRPGAKFYRTAPDKKEFRTNVEYNSKGLNDYEYDYEKDPNTVRILIFGDSFVEASEVKKEENFCKIIEENLNSGSAIQKFEVINMGIFGYSPILEYLYLKNEGLKYDPDMVILCFFVNDVYEDLFHKETAVFDGNNLPIRVPRTERGTTKDLKGWKRFERELCSRAKGLLNKSKLYVFLKNRIYKILAVMKLKEIEPESNPFFIVSGTSPSEKESAAWDDTLRYIKAMKDLAGEKGGEFLLVTIPVESQISDDKDVAASRFYFGEKPDSSRCEAKIEQFCADQDIDYISLFDEFSKRSAKNLYFRSDGHFNEKGHSITGDIIVSKLKRSGIVKK